MEILDACPVCGLSDYGRKVYQCNQCGKIFCYKDTPLNPQSGCTPTRYARCDCGKGSYMSAVAPDVTQIGVVGGEKRCFIATAVYGSENAPDVLILRRFRDDILLSSMFGRFLINIYYRLSPPVARLLSSNSFLRRVVRKAVVHPIAKMLSTKRHLDMKRDVE